jgi:hypothetical protein
MMGQVVGERLLMRGEELPSNGRLTLCQALNYLHVSAL